MKQFDVICAGQAVVDCVTRGKDTQFYRPNVYRADNIFLRRGGDAANESAALASMGYKVTLVCGLGRDIAGDIVVRDVQSYGADVSRVQWMDYSTPIANIMVAKDGSRLSVSSSATRLPGFRPAPELAKGARVVSLASIFRPPFEDPSALYDFAAAAKEDGAQGCADTKLPLMDYVRIENYREVFPLIDHFLPNETEAEYFSGKKTFRKMADFCLEMGAKNVIIKAGARGCYASDGKDTFELPAAPAGPKIDTTGAGDNFVAGYISGLLGGESLEGCANRGLLQAARAITVTEG